MEMIIRKECALQQQIAPNKNRLRAVFYLEL